MKGYDPIANYNIFNIDADKLTADITVELPVVFVNEIIMLEEVPEDNLDDIAKLLGYEMLKNIRNINY